MSSRRIAELEAHLSQVTGGSLPEEIDALNALAQELGAKDGQRTRILAQRALAQSRFSGFQKPPYLKGIAWSLYNLGFLASQSSDFSSALSLLTESRETFETPDFPAFPELTILVYKELGWVYFNLGELPKAYDVLLKSLRIAQESGSAEMEARVLITLSSIYAENGDLDSSAGSLRQAIEYLQGSEHQRDYCVALNNLAMTLLDQKALEDAQATAGQCVSIARQLNQPGLVVTTLDTAAQIYLARKDFASAEECLVEALATHQGFGNDIAEITLNLAKVKMGQGLPQEAQKILMDALPPVEARGVNRFIYQYHELLAGIFEAQGDCPNAIRHIKRFHEVKYGVFNEQTQRQVTSLTVLHQEETARMDAKIFRLRNKALQQEVIEHRKAVAEMNILATTDALTGLMNRRHFMTLAEYTFDYDRKGRLPSSALMIDLDHFKRVNDQYGHLTGDQVLIKVSALIQAGLRGGDLLCRFGGEEFMALLPNTPQKGAVKVAQRLLKTTRETTILVDGHSIQVTFSIGVAQTEPEDSRIEEVMERADQALYAAKKAGRGSVKAFIHTGALNGDMDSPLFGAGMESHA